MRLLALDWAIVAAYFVISAAIGIAVAGRAKGSLADFFVSGRSIPWWLAGTSMVATTFAADTPLVVTGMVAKHGVAGNWLWWNGAFSGILTVFFFARLWRRAGVVTDAQLAELRYSGKPAAVLRAVRALYLALPVNLIIMGWVTRGMMTVLDISLGIRGWNAIVLLFVITTAYSVVSGLWGVLLTDFFQFGLAMGGCIVLAVLAVNSMGGLGLLASQAAQHYGGPAAAFGILPPINSPWLPLSTLLVFLAVQWWATWYPGSEPGGGGYIAQRIFATRDERQGLLATLWFNIAHYALRPWPWILVAFFSVLRYPGLKNPEEGYVRAMVDLLPTPLKGLMLAAFAAAYMSTISTHLNWGASYLVNDVYLRFVRKTARAGEQVLVSRIATVVLMILALVAVRFFATVESGWKFLLAMGAGTGLVLIFRWYWWRINAWSELAAMAASLVTSVAVQTVGGYDAADPSGVGFAVVMLWTVAVTTVVWVAVMLLTPPERPETLAAFYRRVRPGGPGWRAVALPLGYGNDRIPGGALSWANWIAGLVAVFSTLAAIGQFLLGSGTTGVGALALAAICFGIIARNLGSDRSFTESSVDTRLASS